MIMIVVLKEECETEFIDDKIFKMINILVRKGNIWILLTDSNLLKSSYEL